MKEKAFIIPKLKFVLYVIILSVFSLNYAYAIDNYGCLVTYTASQRLYYTAKSGGGAFDYVTLTGSPGFGGYFSVGTARCIDNYGTTCNVYNGTNGALYRTGVYARLYDCPIDGYTTLMFIFTTAVAIFKLNRLRLIT